MQRQMPAEKRLKYSEILRVIGFYADRAHLNDIRLLETDDGIIVQGRVMAGQRAGELDTYQLTLEDIETLQSDARAQRGTKL